MADIKHWGTAPYTIKTDSGETCHIWVKGRDRWALESLLSAGETGCTPIDDPAPRWSGYIHNLRNAGVAIETIHETHGGDFSGTHGRYVLRCVVVKGVKS